MIDLAAIALALPDVEQGIACAGTSLECRTYVTAKKAFLFVSVKEARLKLGPSSPDAREHGFAVGANGWVKLPIGALPRAAVLRKWVAESHALASVGGRKATVRTKPRDTARKKPRR